MENYFLTVGCTEAAGSVRFWTIHSIFKYFNFVAGVICPGNAHFHRLVSIAIQVMWHGILPRDATTLLHGKLKSALKKTGLFIVSFENAALVQPLEVVGNTSRLV